MDKIKQWVALTAVGALAILALGWFFLVSPKRSDAANLRTEADQVTSANQGLQAQLDALKALNKQVPQFQKQLAAVQAKIPSNPALPSLIRALSAAADSAGVELVTVSPSTPAAYTPSQLATGTAAPRTATPSAAGAGTSTGTGATATPGGAAATAAPSLQVITLTLNVAGGYFETEQFFNQLESLSRAVKVTGFTMAPGSNPMKATALGGASAAGADQGQADGSQLTTNITASVFMAPVVAAAPASTTPVAVPAK